MRVCIIDSDGGSSASSSLSHSSLVLLHLWSPSHLLNLIASVAGANERGDGDVATRLRYFYSLPLPLWLASSPALWCTGSAFSRGGSGG